MYKTYWSDILTVLWQHWKTAFCLLAVSGLQCVWLLPPGTLLEPLGTPTKGWPKWVRHGTVIWYPFDRSNATSCVLYRTKSNCAAQWKWGFRRYKITVPPHLTFLDTANHTIQLSFLFLTISTLRHLTSSTCYHNYKMEMPHFPVVPQPQIASQLLHTRLKSISKNQNTSFDCILHCCALVWM